MRQFENLALCPTHSRGSININSYYHYHHPASLVPASTQTDLECQVPLCLNRMTWLLTKFSVHITREKISNIKKYI